MNLCKLKHYRRFTCGLVLMLMASSVTFANEVFDVNHLLQNKQLQQALAQADAFLEKHPKDAQMLFLKGLILSEQNEPGKAIAVFSKLTDDYPKLPEPYNNLAVLFASQGQYDQARAILEKAVRINPVYEIAHENLGDIYVKLAAHSYSNMLQLDPNNVNVRLKHALTATVIAQAPGNSVAATPANGEQKTITTPEASRAASVTIQSIAPPANVAILQDMEEKKPQETESAVTERNKVLATIASWAQAWSARDVAAYMKVYGDNFGAMNKEARAQWENTRRARIEGKSRIKVVIEAPTVIVEGLKAKANFRQIYKSDGHSSRDKKFLLLEKQNGEWKIVEERKQG